MGVTVQRLVVIATATAAMLVPATAFGSNPGSEHASPCGAYHGEFAFPAHGALGPLVSEFASSGLYKGGFVGNNASNPACHQ
jgi:hypothetical protein